MTKFAYFLIAMVAVVILLGGCSGPQTIETSSVKCTNYHPISLAGILVQAARDLPRCEDVRK